MKAVAAALDAYDASRNDAGRLRHALAAWRACRAPGLGSLVERVGASIVTDPRRKPAAAEALADPGKVDAFLARIRRARRTDYCVRAIEALLAGPPDPRYATWALAILADPPLITARTAPFWQAVVRLLDHGRDARHDPQVQRVRALPDTRLHAELAQQVTSWLFHLPIASHTIRLPAELTRRIDARTERYQPPRAVALAQSLLAEIHAHPDDRDLRAVFADLLSRQADPRGEFIALQLHASAGEGRRRGAKPREEALLRAHWRRWAHPLSQGFEADALTFSDGFVSAVRFEQFTWSTPPAERARRRRARVRSAGHPVWSTVETIHVDPEPDLYGTLADHLVAPRMEPARSALRRWTGRCPFAVFEDFALGAPTRLTSIELGVDRPPPLTHMSPRARRALSEAPGLPALRHLSIGWPGYTLDGERWFMRTRLARRLERLHLIRSPASLPRLLVYLRVLRLQALEIGERDGGSVELLRRRDGWSRLVVRLDRGIGQTLSAALAELPPDLLRSVKLIGEAEFADEAAAVRAALSGQRRLG